MVQFKDGSIEAYEARLQELREENYEQNFRIKDLESENRAYKNGEMPQDHGELQDLRETINDQRLKIRDLEDSTSHRGPQQF
jgi:cell division protein FtsL